MDPSREVLDISQVTSQTGLRASTLRHWESLGLVEPSGRRGLRRQYEASVLHEIAYIRLAQAAGFSLDEIATWIRSGRSPEIDRAALRTKADEIDETIERLKVVRDGLRHAADCPAASHAECPNFRALLQSALSGELDGERSLLGARHF